MGDKITYLYVQDTDGRLLGVVPVRRLLGSEPDAASSRSWSAGRIFQRQYGLDACEVLWERFLLFRLSTPAIGCEASSI